MTGTGTVNKADCVLHFQTDKDDYKAVPVEAGRPGRIPADRGEQLWMKRNGHA